MIQTKSCPARCNIFSYLVLTFLNHYTPAVGAHMYIILFYLSDYNIMAGTWESQLNESKWR
jgi:hypothetical protein